MPRFAMRSPYCQSSWVCEYVWTELHRLHKFEAPQQALSWRVGELASAWSKLETFRGMDWSMPTLDILNSKEEVVKPKDPQLCRQINDYNLTMSWISGFTQFYNQCSLAFLGSVNSVKKLCKVDFDPLCTFSYFLILSHHSHHIAPHIVRFLICSELFGTVRNCSRSSIRFPRIASLCSCSQAVISRARRSAHRSRSVAWNRMPKSSENGFRMLRNAWENENMRRYAQISKVIEILQVSWNLKIVVGCVMEARGRINVDVGKGRFKLLHVTVLISTVSTCNYYEGGPIH